MNEETISIDEIKIPFDTPTKAKIIGFDKDTISILIRVPGSELRYRFKIPKTKDWKKIPLVFGVKIIIKKTKNKNKVMLNVSH